MKIVLTELIILQAKAVFAMFCAGVIVETMWQLKNYAKSKVLLKNKNIIILEGMFWLITSVVFSKFLYYSTFGRITLYTVIGFLTGLLLWKKICCAIIKEVWVEKEEGAAANLKTTARSSTLIKLEKRGWKRDRQKKGARKKK